MLSTGEFRLARNNDSVSVSLDSEKNSELL